MNTHEFAKLVKSIDRDAVMVWFGENGAAIHPGTNAETSVSCTQVEARFLVSKFRLFTRECFPDGVMHGA